MHQQHVAGRQLETQVFGTTGHAANELSFKTRNEIGSERIPEVRATRDRALDTRVRHRAMETPAFVLDFGEFWHVAIVGADLRSAPT